MRRIDISGERVRDGKMPAFGTHLAGRQPKMIVLHRAFAGLRKQIVELGSVHALSAIEHLRQRNRADAVRIRKAAPVYKEEPGGRNVSRFQKRFFRADTSVVIRLLSRTSAESTQHLLGKMIVGKGEHPA